MSYLENKRAGRPAEPKDSFQCLVLSVTAMCIALVVGCLVVVIVVDSEAWPLLVLSAAILVLWLAAPFSGKHD